jgi:uncharacterized protein HemX
MSIRAKTNWTLIITLGLTAAGWLWVAAQKSSDVDQLKQDVNLLTTKHDEEDRRLNDVSGDVRVIKAILERIEAAIKNK